MVKRNWLRLLSCILATAWLGAGCGGDSGGNDNDGGNETSKECREGAMASSDDFLPLSEGNVWIYNVTPAAGGPTERKRQEIKPEITPPGESDPVIVQLTTKGDIGSTESWLRRQGDVVVRLRQQDFDATGALEQTTVYSPHKIRFDASSEHLAADATWSETYTRTVTDSAGATLSEIEITDAWTVLGTGVTCKTGWGAELECLHLRRERITGGVANKEFYFARSYGKVLETGGQTEELTECALE